MAFRIASPGSGLIALTLLLFAGSVGAQEVSPRCEAAIDRAAGAYSQCLLRADAQHARVGKARKLERRQARCENRFNRRTTRVIGRHEAGECASALLVAAIADRTVVGAEGVAMEAGGQAATSRMYVQTAEGGMLTESTLTLTGASLRTGWFTSRPYRAAGRMPTAEFVALFSEEGANSFAANPPNADLACESGGLPVTQVVTLTEPVLYEATGTLTYTAALVASAGDEDSFAGITCDTDADLFIDSTLGSAPVCPPTESYDCFVGGFCAQGAITYPPTQYGYTNSYAGDTRDTGAALAAGCNTLPESNRWTFGAGMVSVITTTEQVPELGRVCDSKPAIASTCTPDSSYHCFVGGFCAEGASEYPPGQYGYTNLYENDTQDSGAALAAGCSTLPGSNRWTLGAGLLSLVITPAKTAELELVCSVK